MTRVFVAFSNFSGMDEAWPGAGHFQVTAGIAAKKLRDSLDYQLHDMISTIVTIIAEIELGLSQRSLLERLLRSSEGGFL